MTDSESSDIPRKAGYRERSASETPTKVCACVGKCDYVDTRGRTCIGTVVARGRCMAHAMLRQHVKCITCEAFTSVERAGGMCSSCAKGDGIRKLREMYDEVSRKLAAHRRRYGPQP